MLYPNGKKKSFETPQPETFFCFLKLQLIFLITSLMLDPHHRQSSPSPSHLKAYFTSDMTYRDRRLKITLSWENQSVKGGARHAVISCS